MALRGARRVVAVDSLASNCVILRGFVETARQSPGDESLAPVFSTLNSLPPTRGYITDSYAGAYFTVENCLRMDAIRGRIESMRVDGELSDGEHAILLGAFLLAADRVANTIGQYDAFLKHIDKESMVSGRHLVDERVRSRFSLQPLERIDGLSLEVVQGDMIGLAPRVGAEVVYYDPPYNGRQYCDNYHVLENLALWQKPALFGKTRKFDRSGMRSPFSSAARAENALEKLIAATPARDIFLSYSSEGILSRQQIREILARRGNVEEIETEYPVFGNGAGVSVRRNVTELLFHLRAGRHGSGAR